MSDSGKSASILSADDFGLQPSNEAPRSVIDYATNDDLRKALSQVIRNDSSTVAMECSFHAEPDPEYDIDWRIDNVDRAVSYEQTVEREMNRLLVLKSYLDLDYEKLIAEGCAFDGITRLAKKYFNVPICNVVLLDIGRIWILSQEGKQFNMMRRKDTFCSHVIVSRQEIYLVPDASKDPRLCHFPYVTMENGIRFYAACPLKSPEGVSIGTFCIMDVQPRPEGMSHDDQLALKDFARLAMEALVHQREMHRQQQELEAAARRLASASHDLVTPLSVVQLSMSLLNEDPRFLVKLNETQREYFQAVTNSSETMAHVCESLKMKRLPSEEEMAASASRHDESVDADPTTNVGPACTVTSKLVQRLSELAPSAMGNSAGPLSISVDESVPGCWVGNEVQLLHICLHLLVNAAERSSSHAQIKFVIRSGESLGHEALIFECKVKRRIQDDAGGNLEAIFDEQVVSSYSAKVQADIVQAIHNDGRSSPLGILSPGFNEIHYMQECFPATNANEPSLDTFAVQLRSLGGSFGVANNTASTEITFWFAIPLLLPGELTHPDNKCEYEEMVNAKPPAAPECRKRALVIDDSVIMRKMLCRALEQLGYDIVHQAADGMDGLQCMKEHTYDLVLLDFLMPVMDGMDCVRAFRQWEKKNRPSYNQVICGMSAHASPHDVDRGLLHGMTHYRSKPLSLNDLKQLRDLTASTVDASRTEKKATLFSTSLDDSLSKPPQKATKRQLPELKLPTCSMHSTKKACLFAIGSDGDNVFEMHDNLDLNIEWQVSIAHSWMEVMHLLKARNWDSVMMDTSLQPEINGSQEGFDHFREWEQKYRVHRQRSLLLMGKGIRTRQPSDKIHLVHVPVGFDAVIERPNSREELACILSGIDHRPEGFREADIVTST
ncbi:hypothetical protein MPSEU_000819700 [Mayamaea pseudoterrestris]|nr:hypothetical protein MPSEU_000819700 [Mayamaea pseudoterrestris]